MLEPSTSALSLTSSGESRASPRSSRTRCAFSKVFLVPQSTQWPLNS